MRAILTYHSLDESGSPVSVSPAAFRAHCAFLASGRVRVEPLATLVAGTGSDDAVALTFDDGFASFWDIAVPTLREHGLPATVFVVTGHVGGFNDWGGQRAAGIPHLPLMDWDQVERLGECGVTVGAHTRAHPALPGLSAARLLDELDGASEILATRLGQRPETFAYPYGAVDPAVADAVRPRYRLACTTELRPLGAAEDPALLPRLDMVYLRSPGALEHWGSPAFRAFLWVRGQGRRVRARFLPSPLPRHHVA